MNTEELESLLEGGAETPTFEVKGAMAWSVGTLVKDILAMANVQDGGTILIGVADGTFAREGLTADQQRSFKIDIMRDQVAPFADPSVSFSVSFPIDNDGKTYVAIDVQPFKAVPVICARDGHDVAEGTVYYRSDAKRVQSARVSNAGDMRDIVETAVARSGQRLARLGFVAAEKADLEVSLDKELGGL